MATDAPAATSEEPSSSSDEATAPSALQKWAMLLLMMLPPAPKPPQDPNQGGGFQGDDWRERLARFHAAPGEESDDEELDDEDADGQSRSADVGQITEAGGSGSTAQDAATQPTAARPSESSEQPQ